MMSNELPLHELMSVGLMILIGLVSNLVVPYIKNFEMGLYIKVDETFQQREANLYNLMEKVRKQIKTSKLEFVLMCIPYSAFLDWFINMYCLRQFITKNPSKDTLDYLTEVNANLLMDHRARYLFC